MSLEFSGLIIAQILWCDFLSNFLVTPVWTCKLLVCCLNPHVLDKPDRLKRRYYWCLHLSDFHLKRHALFTCRVSPLFCPVGMLAAVNGVTLCLFQVCRREANWGVCVWKGNQTCCFSRQSIYHLLKCHMKLRQGKVSGVCMWYGRETDTLCRSLSASLFQLISPQVSTACEAILESFLSFSKQFRMPCEYIISLVNFHKYKVQLGSKLNRYTQALLSEWRQRIKCLLLMEGQKCWLLANCSYYKETVPQSYRPIWKLFTCCIVAIWTAPNP